MISNFYSEKTTTNAIKNPKKRLHFLNMRLDFLPSARKGKSSGLRSHLKPFVFAHVTYILLHCKHEGSTQAHHT
jgi:hypothetical protein